MKNYIGTVARIGLFAMVLTACNKNNNNNTTSPGGLTLSASSLAKGEPLVVTADASSGSVVRWTVDPASAGTWISATGNKSVIVFSSAGQYNITAGYYTDSTSPTPYDSSASPVTVSDSVYNDSSGQWAQCTVLEQVPLSNNDQVFLTPISYSDTGLVLIAHTQLTYGNSYPLLNCLSGPDSVAGYEYVFGEVTESPCVSSGATGVPATGIISFGGSVTPLNMGTSEVTFILNGNAYKGSLTVTASACTFSWSYSSGVTIAPLTIEKQ